MNVETTIAKVVEDAKNNLQDVRFVKNHIVGRILRQGDVYLHMVADTHKRGEKIESKQLAQGTSQGARHIAEGNCCCYEGVALPHYIIDGVFLGPLLVVKSRSIVTHPTHAEFSLPPGYYQVTHQTDAITRRRVAD